MLKIEERIKKWWNESSWFRRISDILFYLFILAILIPGTRTPIITGVHKLKMFSPKVSSTTSAPMLQADDYQMSFISLTGERISMEELKGEVVLLNFWATWCPPCRAEMPSLQKLYDDYGNKIKMVLISSEKAEPIEKFMSDHNYEMPIYLQTSQSSSSFATRSIPTTFLISRDGRIVSSKTGSANWNSEKFRQELDKLLQ